MPPQTYSYVKKDNSLGYTTDQSNAPDIAPTSGFALEKSAPISTPTPTPQPTMSEFQNVYTPQNTEADRFQQKMYKEVNAPVDQNQIRQNYINQFQDQINALNQVYDNQLAQARQEGVGRVGSGTAILARRGLAGSPRGESIKEGVLEQNRGIERAIQNERNMAVQAIYGEATKLAAQEAADKRAAKERGASAYLDYLKGQDTRRESNLTSTIGALISQGVDPSTMDASEISNLAKTLGVDTQSILGSYKVAKAQADAQAAAAEAKAMQDGQFNLSEGQSRYDAQGNVIASKGKTYAPSTRTSGLNTPSAPVSDAAQNIIDQLNTAGGTIDDYIKGTSIASQNLRNEVLRGLNAQGGLTDRSTELFDEAKAVVDTLLNEGGYKALGGYSTRLGGQFTTEYGDAKARAQQLEAILARDNLGLLKGAMSDKDLAFIQSMSSGFQGEGIQSDAFIKKRLEEIQLKLEKRLAPGLKASGEIVFGPNGEEIEIVDPE